VKKAIAIYKPIREDKQKLADALFKLLSQKRVIKIKKKVKDVSLQIKIQYVFPDPNMIHKLTELTVGSGWFTYCINTTYDKRQI
jgi:hypothetical protein